MLGSLILYFKGMRIMFQLSGFYCITPHYLSGFFSPRPNLKTAKKQAPAQSLAPRPSARSFHDQQLLSSSRKSRHASSKISLNLNELYMYMISITAAVPITIVLTR